MKKILATLLLVFFAGPVLALELGVNLRHYARDMEFYYAKPRPDSILPLLRKLSGAGALAAAENRLMLAAFLAALSREKKLNLPELIEKNLESSRDIKRTLAWSARLAALANEDEFLDALLGPGDDALRRQIKSSPQKLREWPLEEKSAILMRWGAFMAAGNAAPIDDIIRAALRGRRHNNYAAASLFEYAPRHPLVANEIKRAIEKANPDERRLLRMILAGEEN